MSARVFFFGCWNRSGHFLWTPDGRQVHEDGLCFYGQKPNRHHLDGSLAPRKHAANDRIFHTGEAKTHEEAQRLSYESEECPQGRYLVHHLPNGFTAMSWWDRNQGDGRGACNSTFLMEGKHDALTMRTSLAEHFPHVVENLDRAGVALVPGVAR